MTNTTDAAVRDFICIDPCDACRRRYTHDMAKAAVACFPVARRAIGLCNSFCKS